MMTLPQRRCPYCAGKNIAQQRPYTLTSGTPRTLYYCSSCLRTCSATRQPPPGPMENAHCPRGARACSPYRRGREQRGDAPVWCQQKEDLSLARAAPWRKKTLRLFALPQQFLHQRSEGAALDTRVKQTVVPDESQGWTMGLMDRAPRFLWDMHGGRQNRTMWKKAMGLLGQVLEHPGALTLRTEGEQRSGSLLCARWSPARRHGQRGRPKKTRPTGVPVRLQKKGAP